MRGLTSSEYRVGVCTKRRESYREVYRYYRINVSPGASRTMSCSTNGSLPGRDTFETENRKTTDSLPSFAAMAGDGTKVVPAASTVAVSSTTLPPTTTPLSSSRELRASTPSRTCELTMRTME